VRPSGYPPAKREQKPVGIERGATSREVSRPNSCDRARDDLPRRWGARAVLRAVTEMDMLPVRMRKHREK
jgi:hypothetical protein